MGRRSKKSDDVDTPENEKLGNVGAKRKPRNEMDRSAKKQKLAAVAMNHGMNSTTASIPEKKLPTSTSLDENSTSMSKKEDDIDNNNDVGTSGQVHVDEDDINDYSEAGKAGQVHVDEPTRDCTAPAESGKTDDEPHKLSKKRSKKNSKKLSKKKLKKEDDVDNGVNVGESNQVHVDEGAEANQSANKEDEASVDKNHSSKTLFVANLSSPISKDQITEFFKDAGEIFDVRFPKQFRGFCYVEFVDEATAQKALKKNGEKLMGRDIVLSNEIGHKSRGKLSIFVKGLDGSQPLEEIQKSLKEYFGSCGEITYVLTPVKRSGVSKGFAFLGFKDEDALSKAFELNNTKLGDCILTVEEVGKCDGSGDGGCFDDSKRDGFGGSDDFDSGKPDDIGGGGALDSSSDFGSGGDRGFGGCPGCDSIFCHGGSFGGGNGFNSGSGFRGESGFSGGKSGESVGGREARRGGGQSHSGGGQGRGGGQSHSGSDQGRRGGQAPNGSRGRRSGRGHGGSRGRH